MNKNVNAKDTLQKLIDGNQRFVTNTSINDAQQHTLKRKAHLDKQSPLAVIIGCVDARVPIEILFDQSIGDLFVIRIAGNIMTPEVIGSIEFAVEQLGTGLIIVLGHSDCGAVTATIDHYNNSFTTQSAYIESVIKSIDLAVNTILKNSIETDYTQLLSNCIEANVSASVKQLITSSSLLQQGLAAGQLTIKAAKYELTSGQVNFL